MLGRLRPAPLARPRRAQAAAAARARCAAAAAAAGRLAGRQQRLDRLAQLGQLLLGAGALLSARGRGAGGLLLLRGLGRHVGERFHLGHLLGGSKGQGM